MARERMKALVYERYGGPEVLRIEDVPMPSPGEGEVLVKVAATSINLSDWETLNGTPFYSRLAGLRAPRVHTLGSDIAGTVEEVGPGVTRVKPGDEVYADNLMPKGGFAEYAVVPQGAIALKPSELSFVDAAAIPQAGVIAHQGVVMAGPGRRMLINGAGGGSGSFAIQLAKRLGAHVTGVDNAEKLDFMRSLGADEVIDYRVEDYTRGSTYDVILDLVAYRSVFAYRRALAPGGWYRCVGGTTRSLLRLTTLGLLVGKASGRSIGVMAVKEGPAHFTPVGDLCVAGELRVHVDRVFSLERAVEALAYLGEGHARGKVVVTP